MTGLETQHMMTPARRLQGMPTAIKTVPAPSMRIIWKPTVGVRAMKNPTAIPRAIDSGVSSMPRIGRTILSLTRFSFSSPKRRAWLEKAVNEFDFPDEEVEKFITERMPVVEIAVCKHNVAISFPDRGKKYKGKKTSKRLSPAECEQKYCACMFGEGDCNERKLKKCLKRAGVKDPGDCGRG